MMRFKFNDGGRSAAGFKSAGDCVARAIAIAAGLPYMDVFNALSAGCQTERLTKRSGKRKDSARNGVHTKRKWFKDYMAQLGFRWHSTMSIGSGCTVHLNENELPATGRLVVNVSKHLTCVIDGVINDTYNPSAERGTTIYPPHTPADQVPKKARWLENGNGWAYKPERCVYGYWIFEGKLPAPRKLTLEERHARLAGLSTKMETQDEWLARRAKREAAENARAIAMNRHMDNDHESNPRSDCAICKEYGWS